MQRNIGILIFDDVEEMDFVGPWEVFTKAAEAAGGDDRVFTVAEHAEIVHCGKGLRVIPDETYASTGELDVLLIPGGSGARREVGNKTTVAWLERIAPTCRWITSVCTGAFLLAGSGLAKGRRITTHHAFIQQLREKGIAEVQEGVRFIRDGNVISAGGVMSGIEMSLWLVEELYGKEVAEETKSYIAYGYPPREKYHV